jgi:hypothetical protein
LSVEGLREITFGHTDIGSTDRRQHPTADDSRRHGSRSS